MQIDILTPEGNVFSGEADGIQLPGVDGLFAVLKGHSALISALKEGRLKVIHNSGEDEYFDVKSGFVEVLDNQVSVLIEGLAEGA